MRRAPQIPRLVIRHDFTCCMHQCKYNGFFPLLCATGARSKLMSSGIAVKRVFARPKLRRANALFTFVFDKAPERLNCSTLPSTWAVANDRRLPRSILLHRRLKLWNPEKLHWSIYCLPAHASKHVVRAWAVRRVREAIIEALRTNGYDRWGGSLSMGMGIATGLETAFSRTPSKKNNLVGAFAVSLLKPAITAPHAEVQEACSGLVQDIMNAQVKRSQTFGPKVHR